MMKQLSLTDESTAVHRACHDANHIALKLLVDYGADFTVCDVQGRAPIHWAVTTRNTECLQVGTACEFLLGDSLLTLRLPNNNYNTQTFFFFNDSSCLPFFL